MKTHAIIPIFIPHEGCPHDCIFCNQNAITARSSAPSEESVVDTIEQWLTTISVDPHIRTREIAFYGGSFTGIPIELQSRYLEIAKRYKDSGKIDKIHLSTRPDYIDDLILSNLSHYRVDIIELGVQSFDENVLRMSNRGHSADIVYRSAQLIKDHGFELGIQLMIGLPGDSHEKCLFSARETVRIAPSIARLYPTVIIKHTGLFELYKAGRYKALSTAEAVETTKEMYKILTGAGINVIRIGLKSTDHIRTACTTGSSKLLTHDNIDDSGDVAGGDFHPAFRQLVEATIAREKMDANLVILLSQSFLNLETKNEKTDHIRLTFTCNSVSFSNMIGNSRSNKLYFAAKFPFLRIRYAVDNRIVPGEYQAEIE